MHAAWALQTTLFISHMCKYACAHKIDDIKPIIQSTHICTRHVYYCFQAHMCLSVMHVPNLECVHLACMQIVSQDSGSNSLNLLM